MSSVLETFLILFDTDAKKAADDIDGLDKGLDKTEKTTKKTINTSDKLGKEFVRMGKSAIGAVAGIVALGASIKGMFDQTQDLHQLLRESKALEVNIGELDAWGKAIESNGGSADTFRASLHSLNSKFQEVSITGKSDVLPYFNALGVSMVDAGGKARNTLEVLPEIADAMQGLSAGEQLHFGKKLGLDKDTILMLQQGRREIETMVDRQKQFGVATEEAAELSAEFTEKMQGLKQVFTSSSQTILTAILPAVNWLLDAFTNIGMWAAENQDIIEGLFIGIGAAILYFALPPLIALLAPFLLIGIAIGLVVLAIAFMYEELKAFFNGQDGLLTRAVEKWPLLGKVICKIAGFIGEVIEGFKSFGSFLAELWNDPLAAMEKFHKLLESIVLVFKSAGKGVLKFLGVDVGDEAEQSKDRMMSQAAIADAQTQRNMAEFRAAGETPLNQQTSNSVSNSNSSSSRNTTVNVGEIAIKTEATDADGIMADAAGSLDQQLRSTVENFDDGVSM